MSTRRKHPKPKPSPQPVPPPMPPPARRVTPASGPLWGFYGELMDAIVRQPQPIRSNVIDTTATEKL